MPAADGSECEAHASSRRPAPNSPPWRVQRSQVSADRGPFDQDDLACLRVAFNRLIPADGWPGGWDGGVGDYLSLAVADDLAWAAEPLRDAVELLSLRSLARFDRPFAALAADDADAVLRDLFDGDERAAAAMLRVVYEGYYGAGGSVAPQSWQMVGFTAVPDGVVASDPPLPSRVSPGALLEHYDVVVVGAGAGGGVAAAVLAEAGLRVLLLERAAPLRDPALRGDHLHGKRQAVYRPTAGPGVGNPRVVVDEGGGVRNVDGDAGGRDWGLNANCLGGGTRVWQGMAWRFMAQDFAMASCYGVPADSTLADWPISYDDLEPYYSRAEQEIGVSGACGPLTQRTPRSAGYPLPPMPPDDVRRRLAAAAERLGWGWGPVPLAINSVPAAGRPACVRCDQCIGHACPVNAKNGTHNTFIPRALAAGAHLLMSAQAVEVMHRGPSASGVRIAIDDGRLISERTIGCELVVVAAGAIETPRLLLASGLGNDQLGRHLHAHGFSAAVGRSPEPIEPYRGPGHSIASLEFVHTASVGFGGGVLFDLAAPLPLAAAELAAVLGVPSWGREHKLWMREGISHTLGVASITQELPSSRASVTIDRHVRDRRGVPAARIRPHAHPLTHEIEGEMTRLAAAWLEASDCTSIVDLGARWHAGPRPPADEHSAGTARMGDDPARSACDRFGQLHGTANVYVCDASLHPTNGSVNPTLTILANAMRIAEHLARD